MRAIRFTKKVAAITSAGDLSGCFRDPIQTDSMLSPATRSSRPRTMVSTSGSSGTIQEYKIVNGSEAAHAYRHRNYGLLLQRYIRYAGGYTPAPPITPVS